MSSWLARSIVNSLTLDDEQTAPSISEQDVNPYKSDDYDSDQGEERGVKDDLSELKDSLTQQFWGVASFLAPPPPPPPLPPPPFSFPVVKESVCVESEPCVDDEEEEEEEEEQGFGDYYYSDCEEGEEEEEAVGITEEVLAFAMNIAHHPETWLDFPLLDEEEYDGEEEDQMYLIIHMDFRLFMIVLSVKCVWNTLSSEIVCLREII